MDVKLDEKKSLFYIDFDRGGKAVLLYKLNKRAKVMDLYHTEVPIEHRGKGIGGILVKHALEYARTNGLRVEATCTFVQNYLSKHQDYPDVYRS